MDKDKGKTYSPQVVRFKWILGRVIQSFFQCKDLSKRLGGIVGESLALAGIGISGEKLDELGGFSKKGVVSSPVQIFNVGREVRRSE